MCTITIDSVKRGVWGFSDHSIAVLAKYILWIELPLSLLLGGFLGLPFLCNIDSDNFKILAQSLIRLFSFDEILTLRGLSLGQWRRPFRRLFSFYATTQRTFYGLLWTRYSSWCGALFYFFTIRIFLLLLGKIALLRQIRENSGVSEGFILIWGLREVLESLRSQGSFLLSGQLCQSSFWGNLSMGWEGINQDVCKQFVCL